MKPSLLYVTADWPWPPTSGGRLQAAYLAEHLGESYDVTVLAIDRDDTRHPAWSGAMKVVAARRASQLHRAIDTVGGLVGGRQVLLERLRRSRAPEALAAVIGDLQPAVCVFGRPIFAEFIDVAAEGGAIVIIEANEDLVRVGRSIARSNAPLRSRLIAAVDAVVVGRQQRRNYPRADRVLVCSPTERNRIARYVPGGRIDVIPNAVPIPSGIQPGRQPIAAIAYVGAYRYAPNEAAAIELIESILPSVRRAGGPGRLLLIGRDPTPRMRRLAASDSSVEITGEVDDVVDALGAAGVLLVPLRAGAGTRVKILEAAAGGIPVISSRFGVEGLEFVEGRHFLPAETADDFAAAVLRLRDDPGLRRRLAEEAASHVAQRHSPKVARDAVRSVLGRIESLRTVQSATADRTGATPAQSRAGGSTPVTRG